MALFPRSHEVGFMSVVVNGREADWIPVSDRGFQYGDGLFETLFVDDGEPRFLARHLQRLRSGCDRLSIEFPGERILTDESRRISKSSNSAILKIMVTRGSGGRGYRIPDPTHPTRVLSIHPSPEYPVDYRSVGIRVIPCRSRLGINPALAGLKHLNRLEQILARSEWSDPGIQEGIMLDTEDKVVEGTMSNVFFVRKDVLLTPDLDRCGVAGVIRSVILEIAERNGIPIRIGRFVIGDLEKADEVFVSNSVIGIWPVTEFGRTRYGIGPVTRVIMQCLKDCTE